MAHDGHLHTHPHPPIGHNGQSEATQWQTPHLHDGDHRHEGEPSEPDLDLVETAFLEGFRTAPDPTSFLRLAGIPFVGRRTGGATLSLLRVEIGQTTDVGGLTPHLGGASHRYDPLPAALTSRRQTLRFAYFDGGAVVELSLAEARSLESIVDR